MGEQDNEFDLFYEQAILFEVQRCEAIRNEIRAELKRPKAKSEGENITVPIILMAIVSIVSLVFSKYGAIIIPVMVVIYIVVLINNPRENTTSTEEILAARLLEIKKIYKESIFLQIFRYYYPEVKYLPDGHFSLRTVRNSFLFSPLPKEIRGEDYIGVPIGESVLRFCQMSTNQMSQGLFGTVTFNKSFKSRTLVISKHHLNIHHRFGYNPSMYIKEGQYIEIDSVEFSEHFIIFTEDPIEAHYILSPALMERILEYDKRLAEGISLSFIRDTVFFRIPETEDLFDLDFMSDEDQYSKILYHTDYFLYITEIVEALNLNNNIWNRANETYG